MIYFFYTNYTGILILLWLQQQHNRAMFTSPSQVNRQGSNGGPQAQPGAQQGWPCPPSSSSYLETWAAPQAGNFIPPRTHTHTHTHYKRNITLLNLLSFPVYSGCLSWGLFTFNKIEYESFKVPHCYCLSFTSCMQSDTIPRNNRMGVWEIFCTSEKGMLKRPFCGNRLAKGCTHIFSFFAKALVLKLQFLTGDFHILLI